MSNIVLFSKYPFSMATKRLLTKVNIDEVYISSRNIYLLSFMSSFIDWSS